MPLTLKAINAELAKQGVRLEKGSGYFYFLGGDAATWLDKTVRVPKVSSLTLPQWLAEFERLRKLNSEIMKAKASRNIRKKDVTGTWVVPRLRGEE